MLRLIWMRKTDGAGLDPRPALLTDPIGYDWIEPIRQGFAHGSTRDGKENRPK